MRVDESWDVTACVTSCPCEPFGLTLKKRHRIGGDMSFMAFDLLALNGQDVMREP